MEIDIKEMELLAGWAFRLSVGQMYKSNRIWYGGLAVGYMDTILMMTNGQKATCKLYDCMKNEIKQNL